MVLLHVPRFGTTVLPPDVADLELVVFLPRNELGQKAPSDAGHGTLVPWLALEDRRLNKYQYEKFRSECTYRFIPHPGERSGTALFAHFSVHGTDCPQCRIDPARLDQHIGFCCNMFECGHSGKRNTGLWLISSPFYIQVVCLAEKYCCLAAGTALYFTMSRAHRI